MHLSLEKERLRFQYIPSDAYLTIQVRCHLTTVLSWNLFSVTNYEVLSMKPPLNMTSSGPDEYAV